MNRPLNIAHRGGAGLWPENTMAAFGKAVDLGVDGIELDVHITRDGQVAVYHDEALKPDITRDAHGAWVTRKDLLLKDMTYSELSAYDVGRAKPGSSYAESHPQLTGEDGARIPLLRDVIRLVKGTKTKLWIELKSNFLHDDRTATPQVFAEAVIALLRAEDAMGAAVIIGFDWRAVVAAKALAPEVPIWFTTLPQSWFRPAPPPEAHWPPPEAELARFRAFEASTAPWAAGFDRSRYGSLARAIRAGGAQGWFPFYPDVTPQTAAEAHAVGLLTGGWTVNARSEMQRLSAIGVHAICTDYPDALKTILRS